MIENAGPIQTNQAIVKRPTSGSTANLLEFQAEDGTTKLLSVSSSGKIIGYVGSTEVPLEPAALFFDEMGWKMPRIRLTQGRFDLDPSGGRVDVRVQGGSASTIFSIYNLDRSRPFLEGTDTNMNLPGTLTFGDASVQKSAMQTKWLSADVVNNNATANTLADITGLAIPVVSGVPLYFKFYLAYTSAATSTGSRWTISGPTTSLLVYSVENTLTTSSRSVNYGLTSYNLPAAANATSGSTAGNSAVIEGIIVPSASGTLTPRFSSAVASSAITAKVGSHVLYHRNA